MRESTTLLDEVYEVAMRGVTLAPWLGRALDEYRQAERAWRTEVLGCDPRELNPIWAHPDALAKLATADAERQRDLRQRAAQSRGRFPDIVIDYKDRALLHQTQARCHVCVHPDRAKVEDTVARSRGQFKTFQLPPGLEVRAVKRHIIRQHFPLLAIIDRELTRPHPSEWKGKAMRI